MSATEKPPARTWRDWLGLLCRLGVGITLIVSGVLKARSFEYSILAVKGFALFPDWLSTILGYAIPIVEIVVGVMLVVGLFTRAAAAIGALMMLAFIIGIASLWARGLRVDCGCFGGSGGYNENVTWRTYVVEILRDAAIMLPALWLVFRPRTPFAVDNWLFRDPAADPVEDEDPADHLED